MSGLSGRGGDRCQICPKLKIEKRDLEEALTDGNERLTQLQEQIVQLESESQAEIKNLRNEIVELRRLAEDSDMKRKTIERSSEALRSEIKHLNSYITTLPSDDEMKKLSFDLFAKTQECDRLQSAKSSLRTELTKSSTKAEILEDDLKTTKAQCASLSLDLAKAKTQLEQQERRRQLADQVAPGNTESILRERDLLKVENLKLKKLVMEIETARKRELSQLKQSLEEKIENSNNLQEENKRLCSELVDEKKTNEHLRNQVSAAIHECDNERQEVMRLKQELKSTRCSQEERHDLARLEQKLFMEISSCVDELNSLIIVEDQLKKGQNPDTAMFMGFQSPPSPRTNTLSINGKLQEVSKLISEMVLIREKISVIRQSMWDRYADILADEQVNSCHSQ